jgi:hypothetical protein
VQLEHNNLVLIIGESSTCAFLLTFYYNFILVAITLHYHFIPALPEYQPKVYSTLLFPPAMQTYYSEGEDGYEEFFDEEF